MVFLGFPKDFSSFLIVSHRAPGHFVEPWSLRYNRAVALDLPLSRRYSDHSYRAGHGLTSRFLQNLEIVIIHTLPNKGGCFMGRRVLTTIVTITMLAFSLGCSITKPQSFSQAEYVPAANDRILEVNLLDGDKVEFNSEGGEYLPADRVIRGTSQEGASIEVEISDVQSVRVERRSEGLSFTVTVLGLVTLGLGTMYILGIHGQWLTD